MSARPKRIPLFEPTLRGNEAKYVQQCLETGWVSSTGSFVKRFETEFARYVGRSGAVAVSSGTAALHTALLVCGVRPGDEVLVPDLTFVAPANAVRYCGAYPVFIDAEPATWQIDAAKVERFLERECALRDGACVNRRSGRRVRAIIPAHLLGMACEIDRIVDAAHRRGLAVVEDAAEGMGARYKGRHVGSFGDVAAFSFNGNKIMTTGGGGMIATDDARKADYAAYLTTQAKDDPTEYYHREVGYNYRMTNVQAAMGAAQLEQLDGFVERKREIGRRYAAAFASVPGVTAMPEPPHTRSTYWLYTILLEPDATAERRKRFIAELAERGVEARPLWHNLSALPPFKDCQAFELEHSRRLYERAVSLPSSVSLTDAQLDRCVEAVAAGLSRPV